MRCRRSARLTAVAATSIRTSPGPGTGSGASVQTRTSGSPGAVRVTACIVIQHNNRVSTAAVTGDSPLYARVERKVPKLARAMIDAFVKEIPLYSLLPGEPPEGLAARLGVHLAPSFLVVAFQLGSHPDEREGGVGGAIAARRKVRRAQAALDDVAGEPVLSLLEPGGGSALLPLVAG